MNKQHENLYGEYLKYPYMTESEFEIFFTSLWNNKSKIKPTHKGVDGISQKDRQKTIRLLKDHLQFLIDNE